MNIGFENSVKFKQGDDINKQEKTDERPFAPNDPSQNNDNKKESGNSSGKKVIQIHLH